jgi:two-component system sensor histidine kinase QseC
MLALILVSLCYSAGVGWLTMRDSVDEIYELFDVHLAQTGMALLRVTDPDVDETLSIPDPGHSPGLQELFSQWPELPERLNRVRGDFKSPSDTHHTDATVDSPPSTQSQYEKNLRYQVWGSNSQLLLRSANAPDIAMTTQDGLSDSTDEQGRVWRHFGVWDRHHEFRVLVSEDYELRNRLVRSIALRMASPVAIGVPLLIALLWFSIRRGLQPLKLLTTEIEARKPDNLLPLDEGVAPAEVRPMIVALNQLLLRVTESLQGERRFTANAAHELKTPLATLQAQVYVVRMAQSDIERQRALDQLQRGVERGIRLVGQMLTMARLDPEQAFPQVVPMNLGAVVQQVCADLAPLALQRSQILDLDVEPGLTELVGNADMVSMLVSNLLDNAIRYTPDKGFITVQVQQIDGALCVYVSDSGQGIPVAQRSRVFERFYRMDQSGQLGTGLGLAICQRIADLHGATLRVTQGLSGRGTCVQVQFGRQQDEPR